MLMKFENRQTRGGQHYESPSMEIMTLSSESAFLSASFVTSGGNGSGWIEDWNQEQDDFVNL